MREDSCTPELLQAGVDNRYYLQGILKREWDQFYSFSRDCISKGGRSTNIYGTVEQFIKNAGRYVLTSEIKEAFPGVTDAVLNFALMQKRIIACNGKYIHAENLHLTEQHIQELKQTLDMLLADGQAHHSRELFLLASTYDGSWLDEIGVMYQSALFSIAAYLYSSDCVFSRPWIAAKGSAGEETIRQLRGRTDEDLPVKMGFSWLQSYHKRTPHGSLRCNLHKTLQAFRQRFLLPCYTEEGTDHVPYQTSGLRSLPA